MYPIENIIRNSFKKQNEKLSILVINDNNNDYVERLAYELDHTFYVIQHGCVWNKSTKENIILCGNVNEISNRYIDLIITFNRLAGYEYAEKVSLDGHIPIITIDTVSGLLKAPVPFFTTINFTNIDKIALRNGEASIGTSEYVSRSWHNPYQNLSLSIPILAKKIKTTQTAKKILIDSSLPKEYIESINLNLNEKFTNNPEEACIYLHLWQNVTPLMLDCMNSDIPVTTFQSKDFDQIIEQKACIVLQDLNQVNSDNFIDSIMNFKYTDIIKKNALSYVKNNLDNKNFRENWNKVLYHTCNKCFIRGM